MSDFFANILTGTIRRILAIMLGGVVITMNQKLGLGLDIGQVASIAAITIAYIVQSSIRQGKAPSAPELMAMIQAGVEKAMLASNAAQPSPKP